MAAMTSSDAKKTCRRLMRGMFALVPPESRRRLDDALLDNLWQVVALAGEGGALLAFSPLPDEPDLTPLMRRWLAGGGKLALPCWEEADVLRLRLAGDLDRDLQAGRCGILEPCDDRPEFDPAGVCAALVPGRAFSEALDRLGRGAGCYDRLLTRTRALRIGVCYDFQVLPAIPCEDNDIKMDMVVTPGRVVGRHGG